ncbi:MAG: outer membrane beta-barrel protein [Bacteroidetes bacterium]|uniref:Outer membrane beta-barrel protein n=1 Tax=Candidatus Cryptobacteroides avistercoris TaxID=2840758 RepID=A0A9D9IVZ3_9BACT|nr:outer membrane beta-barrel protein [Candidatus Cryptobacteroides avistercoris]
MKKLILSLAIAAIAAGSAMAQVSVGAGYLNQTSKSSLSESSSSKGSSDGFYVGAAFSCPIIAGLSVDPGVYYGFLTSSTDVNIAGFELANGKTQSHYLMIPIDLRYSFHALDFLDVFALAGPRFNVGLASTTTVSALGDAVEQKVDNYGENSSLQRFDFGLGVGIGFDLFQMVRIKVGYDWGLLDVNKTDAVTTNNSMLHAGVAFLF